MENTNDFISFNDRFPSVVDTDDLVWELGRKEVDRLNKEKLLNSLLDQKKQANDSISSMKEAVVKLQSELLSLRAKVEEYTVYNAKLIESNNNLSQHIDIIKSKYETDLVELQNIKNLNNELSVAKNKVLELNSNMDKALVEQRNLNSSLRKDNNNITQERDALILRNEELQKQIEELSSKFVAKKFKSTSK